MFGRFTILARILGRPIVPPKKNWCKEKMYTFSGKNIACLPVPKESDSLLNPCSKNSFTTKFHALGHERVQFTNVSLPSGFTIAANFFQSWSWSPREERNTWFKSNWKVQSQSLSQKTQIAYSTLTKATDSFSFFFLFLFLFSFLFLFLSLFLSLSVPLPFLLPHSLSFSFSRSLSLSLFTFSLKKLKVEKVYNAINMLNPTHYKYYKYHKLIGKNKRFN